MTEKSNNITNREYKSDVFSMLLSDPAYALQVYNALNNTKHKDPAALEIKRLDKGIYLSIRNDASFVLDSYLNLYEHQSTLCPNMPLRCLIYVANLYEDLINHRDIFGSTLIQIPAPRFVVFYNGKNAQPDRQILKLSDAYEKQNQDQIQLELQCLVININEGHSQTFLENCRIMYEYSRFVEEVRRQELLAKKEKNILLREKEFSQALNRAIDICIEEHILEDFLTKHRNEVLRMTTLDYSFERRIELSKAEGIQQGKQEGILQGKQEGILQGKQEGILQGKQEGILQGKQEGIHLIAEVITRLKNGDTPESLTASGIQADLVQLAQHLLES